MDGPLCHLLLALGTHAAGFHGGGDVGGAVDAVVPGLRVVLQHHDGVVAGPPAESKKADV